jgi:hypothetical protein
VFDSEGLDWRLDGLWREARRAGEERNQSRQTAMAKRLMKEDPMPLRSFSALGSMAWDGARGQRHRG